MARVIAPQIRSRFAHHTNPSAKNQGSTNHPLCANQTHHSLAFVLPVFTNHQRDAVRILRDPRRGVTISCRIRAITRTERSLAASRARTSTVCGLRQIQGILRLAPKSSMYRIQPGMLIWEMEIEPWICYGELDNIHSNIGGRDYLCLV